MTAGSRWAAITGWGMSVPRESRSTKLVAAEAQSVDADGRPVDAEWILRRTGIRERRVAAPEDSTSTLAIGAGRAALASAGLDAADLDLIVVATTTPDTPCPPTGPLVQAELRAERAGAFDLNAACAGFLVALGTCDALIRGGGIHRALVIGAEVMTRLMDPQDHRTAPLFGDGAGAVVLEATDAPAGVLALSVGADGEAAEHLVVPAGGSRRPASAETVAAREHFLRMNGKAVYRAAVRRMADAANEVITSAGLSTGEVDLLVCHQANARIVAEVGERLLIPSSRVFGNVDRYGNTSAASIPIALCEAADQGLLSPGARIVATAVGAGLVWAAAAIAWTAVPAGRGASASARVEVRT